MVVERCSEKIEVNVGGQVFVTTSDTLKRDKECYFSSLFRGKYAGSKSSCFIDRDPTHFRYILNYLRDGKVMLPQNEQILYEIRQEAAFYQIHGLLHSVEECQEQLEKDKRNEPSREKKYKVIFSPCDTFKTTFKHWTIKEGYELESCIALPNKEMVLIFTRYYSASDVMLFDRLGRM